MDIKTPFLRTPFNYDREAASNETALECKDPTRAQQSAKEETDINTIVRRFGLTGQLPTNVRAPEYGDFTNITDYRDAIAAIRSAGQSFAQMPANVRARFENDPAKFVDFCMDRNNVDEMKRLGLLVPEAFQKPLDLPAGGDKVDPPKEGTT